MLRCQFLCHVLIALFFLKIALTLSYFCKKMQNIRALGAQPPDPVPPAAEDGAPKPPDSGSWGLYPQTPLAPGGWGLRPQTPKTASPIANFWLRAWVCI